jgi:hypothetical protein
MNITDNLIREIINDAGNNFDSHDIILTFAHKNQRLYVAELAAINNDIPFQTLHSTLGEKIKAISEELGYTGEPSRSRDIFGQDSKCVRWSRK